MMRTGNSAQAWRVNSALNQQDACNTWPKKVYDIIHEYCVILGSIQTYLPILGNTEHNIHIHNAFHKIFPSFTYPATTPGPKSSQNTLGCHFHCSGWSRISTGNVPVKTIGPTISIGNGSSVSSTHSWQFS